MTIPDAVTFIGQKAFYECTGITSVTIGKSVEYIRDYAFDGCTNLTDLTWNAIYCKCDYNVFITYANIEHITIGPEVEALPTGFCYGAKITEVTIPNSVTTINQYVFGNCMRLNNR